MFKADLHIHSQFSDGHWTVNQIIEQAKALSIQGLSITDHDTTDAYPDAFDLASQQEIKMLPGIELTSHHKETTVHVLGYGYDLESPVLQNALLELSRGREQRIHAILERLSRRNIHISHEELTKQFKEGQLGRPHIASLMVQKGYASTISDAFDYYLSDSHMGSLKLKTFDAEQAIEIIRRANGYAVLAHPHLIKHKNKLRAVLSLPFDGIEVYYARYPNKSEYFTDIAKQNDWLVTGGSDFHYPKPYQPLGCSYTPEETFKILYQKAMTHNPKYYQKQNATC